MAQFSVDDRTHARVRVCGPDRKDGRNVKKEQMTALGWFIPDEAITEPRQDKLGYQAFASVLIDAIRSVHAPATIGLLGGFGVGKSSIGNLVKSELSTDKRFDVIRVSADKHVAEARARNLVHSVAGEIEQLLGKGDHEIKRILMPLRHSTERTAADPTDTPAARIVSGDYSPKAVLKSSGLWLLAALVPLVAGIVIGGRWGLGLIGAFVLGALAAVKSLVLDNGSPFSLKVLFEPGTHSISLPRAEAADDVEIVFSKLIEYHHKKRERQLVIFVDDVDRLASEDLLDALRSIKSLQAVPRGLEPIFVLACSEEILLSAIGRIVGEDAGGEDQAAAVVPPFQGTRDDAAHAFLDKLLTVRIPLPHAMPANMRQLARELIPSAHPIHAQQIDLERVSRTLIHVDVNDPRSVIRLWNRFFAAYRTGMERESTGHVHLGDVTGFPVALAKLCVLYDEFPNFYRQVLRNPNLLAAADGLALHRTDGTPADTDALKNSNLSEAVTSWEPYGGERLRTYLTATARTATYPADLIPLLMFAQAPEQSKLGGERYRALERALLTGDAQGLETQLADIDTALHQAVADVLIRLIAETDEYDVDNVVPAAAGGLHALATSEQQRVADALADLLNQHDAVPDTEAISQILDHSSSASHESLCRRLAHLDPAAENDVQNQRMINCFHYYDNHPATAKFLERPVHEWVIQLPGLGGWELSSVWLNELSTVDVPRHFHFISGTALPIILQTVGAGHGITQEEIAGIVELANAAELSPDVVTQQIEEWTTVNNTTCDLAVRLVDARKVPAGPDAAYFAALSTDRPGVPMTTRTTAVSYLADTSSDWSATVISITTPAGSDAPDDEGEETTVAHQLGDVISGHLATAIATDDDVLNSLLDVLASLQTGFQGAEADPLLSALATRAGSAWDNGNTNLAARLEGAAVELAERSDGAAVASALDGFLQPIAPDIDPRDEHVEAAISLIPQLRRARGREALQRLVERLASQLTSPSKSDHASIVAALRAVDVTAPDLLTEVTTRVWPSLAQQIATDPIPTRLHVLAVYPWPPAHAPEVVALIEQHLSMFTDDDTDLALNQLIKLPSDTALRAPLADRLVERVEQNPSGLPSAIAASIWDRWNDTQRQRLSIAAVGRHHHVDAKFAALGVDHAATAVCAAPTAERASALLKARTDAEATAQTALRLVAQGSVLTDEALGVIVENTPSANRPGIAAELIEGLPAERSTIVRVLGAVRRLGEAGTVIPEAVRLDAARTLLPDADEQIASQLGWLLRQVKVKPIDDQLRELKRRDGAASDALEAARSGRTD